MRLFHSLLLTGCFAGVVAGGCTQGTITGGEGAAAPQLGPTGAPVGVGVPCDVGQVLAQACTTCHAGPSATSGVDLTSYDALVAPSKADPTLSVIERSVLRMNDAKTPMPPSGQIAASDIAVLEQWIAAGTPKGTCNDPATTPPVTVQCTSNKTYNGGDDGGGSMYPGEACVACHDKGEGPTLQFGGTIYPTAHEPDDCIGAPGATVVVTDANGTQFSVAAGTNGNFYRTTSTKIAFPIHAEVHANGKILKMNDAINNGDCNACHTTLGTNKAPGRIVAPAP